MSTRWLHGVLFPTARGTPRVCGSRQALLQDLDQPIQILGVQCSRIKPEAGENLRAIDAVRPRRQVFKAIVAADEPVDLVGVELHYDIFLDPGPLVIGLLRAQVVGAARAGDLDEQLRSAGKIAFRVVPDLPPQLGSDVKLTIRLRLPLLIQLDSRSVGAFDLRRLELVIKQPSSDNVALRSVITTHRRRHIDNSSYEFRSRLRRHRLVALVEGGLVKPLAGDQRGQSGNARSLDCAHGRGPPS